MTAQFKLPAVNPLMRKGQISAVHAKIGDFLPVGSKFMDLFIDLSDAVLHDCPPVSRYSVLIREPLWLRELHVAAGDHAAVGTVLAIFTRTADEPLSDGPPRTARIAVSSIFSAADWWDAPTVD